MTDTPDPAEWVDYIIWDSNDDTRVADTSHDPPPLPQSTFLPAETCPCGRPLKPVWKFNGGNPGWFLVQDCDCEDSELDAFIDRLAQRRQERADG